MIQNKKTWELINELTSNQQKGFHAKEIKNTSNSTLNSPPQIAEDFNDHCTNIGPGKFSI